MPHICRTTSSIQGATRKKALFKLAEYPCIENACRAHRRPDAFKDSQRRGGSMRPVIRLVFIEVKQEDHHHVHHRNDDKATTSSCHTDACVHELFGEHVVLVLQPTHLSRTPHEVNAINTITHHGHCE